MSIRQISPKYPLSKTPKGSKTIHLKSAKGEKIYPSKRPSPFNELSVLNQNIFDKSAKLTQSINLDNREDLNPKQLSSSISKMWNVIMNIFKMRKLLMFKTGLRKTKWIKETHLKTINVLHFSEEKQRKETIQMKLLLAKNIFTKMYYKILIFFMMSKFFKSFLIFKNYCHIIIDNLPILQPHQRFKILWDMLILCIIIFYFFLIPLQICFNLFYNEKAMIYLEEKNIPIFLIQISLKGPSIMMIIDSCLKFITGYYENGKIIMEKDKIIKNYLKNGLLNDLLAYIPIVIETVDSDEIYEHNSNFGIILKWLQILIYLKLKTLKSLLRNFENAMSLYGISDHILSLLRLTVVILFGYHLSACLWHAVAYYRMDYDYTWLHSSSLTDSDWSSKYLHSIYWAIAFKGKLYPQGDIEIFVSSAISLVLSMNYGFNLGFIGKIVDAMNRDQKEFK